MSPHTESIAPQPDRETISPSPARNALQSNLESGLTLTRKKSWFGSAREWASIGAHHAKGYLEKRHAMRAESGRVRQLQDSDTRSDELSSSDCECSDDESATPFQPTPVRHRTFTPKTAMASLRQHTQSTRGRHKRGTLDDIHRPEEDQPAPANHTPTPTNDAHKGHARKSSVARSLVGSIRGLGKRATVGRNANISPDKVVEQRESSSSSEEDAAFVPLPSSPINITPLPTLSLSLPPSQLNLAFGLSDRACSPRDYLGLQPEDLGSVPKQGPPTPMPGTNCTLELDGANDETELFERNVEYKDEIKKKENRTLKKMVSLDAMAEKCAALSPSDRLNPVHRTVSDVTIKDCPDDMPKLTRELAHLQTPSAGHRDPQTGDWKSEDPFAPGNAVGDLAGQGPPSCGAQVILPLRPKITLQSADSDQPRTLNENDMPTLTERMDGSKILMDQSATATDKVQVCEWSDIEMPSHSNPFFVPEAVHEQKDDVEPDGPIDEPSDLVEVFAIRPQKPALGEATERGAPHTTAGDTGVPLTSDTLRNFDDDEEHILYNPSIDGSDQDSMHGPLHQKSSVMQIYDLLTKTQTPSPKKVTTGLGGSNSTAIFWKFKPWNATPPRAKQTHNEAANDSDGAIKETPPRLRRRSSLDVEPSDSGRSPDAASTVSAMDVSGSPSMGDRVHFDFERADRAKRYAMLADNATAGDEINAVVFDDLDFALQPVSRNEAQVTPTATNQPPVKGRSRQGSAYSIDPDLQADLAEIYEFQNAMSGTTFDPNPVVVETSNPATPVLSSAQPLLQAGKDGYGNDGEPRNASGYQASSPSEDTPALSPGETKFWRDVQSCPFGTPQPIGDESPTQSLHKRQSASILSATPDAGVDGWTHDDRAVDRVPGDASDDVSLRAWVLNMSPSDSEQPSSPAGVGEEMPRSDSEQSLDEGLKLYRSFTSNPDIRYSDTPTIPEEDSPVDRQFASPDSAYNADQSSDAVEPVSPSESRSRKTTVASSPH